jgi:hypothetical protein
VGPEPLSGRMIPGNPGDATGPKPGQDDRNGAPSRDRDFSVPSISNKVVRFMEIVE